MVANYVQPEADSALHTSIILDQKFLLRCSHTCVAQEEACGILAAASEGGAKVVSRLLEAGAIPWLGRALSLPGASQDLICHVSNNSVGMPWWISVNGALQSASCTGDLLLHQKNLTEQRDVGIMTEPRRLTPYSPFIALQQPSCPRPGQTGCSLTHPWLSLQAARCLANLANFSSELRDKVAADCGSSPGSSSHPPAH